MAIPEGSVFLLAINGAVLIVLGLGALVLRRELGLLFRRVRTAGPSVPEALEVGSAVPRVVKPYDGRPLVFFYPRCAPCHDIARELGRLPPASDRWQS